MCISATNDGLVQAKRKRQQMGKVKIVVAGCVASQEGATLLRRVPEVRPCHGPSPRESDTRPTGPGRPGQPGNPLV